MPLAPVMLNSGRRQWVENAQEMASPSIRSGISMPLVNVDGAPP
jgi:hypothetical protein